jgi:hypothetical protein
MEDCIVATIEHAAQVRTADSLNILTGIWLIIAPALIGFGSTGMKWSTIITGLVIGILEATQEVTLRTTWQSWISMVAGLWAIVAPFVFSGTTTGAAWASVVGGILAIIFGAWSVSAVASDPSMHRA